MVRDRCRINLPIEGIEGIEGYQFRCIDTRRIHGLAKLPRQPKVGIAQASPILREKEIHR